MSNITTLPTVCSFLLEKLEVPRGRIQAADLPQNWIPAIPPLVPGHLLTCYSHMQTLDFTNHTIGYQHLDPIARAFPNLVSLRAYTTATLTDITRLLSPLNSKLRTLDLANPLSCERPTYSFQPADFSAYTKLCSLRLPATAFFPSAPCNHIDYPVAGFGDADLI
jgi:hypothetical protein